VGEFLPPRQTRFKIDVKNPITFGTLTLPDYYFEFKKQQDNAMNNVPEVFSEVTRNFSDLCNRDYSSIVPFELEDAKVAIVSLGSASGTVRWVAKSMRKKGLRVGALKVALYRPFPHEAVGDALQSVDVAIVLERSLSLGSHCGPLASDVVCSLYNRPNQPRVLDIVAGLGGRDLSPENVEHIFNTGLEAAKEPTGLEFEFAGVRE
jgi:pyruvate ferredoxin oxidoreductase alpha subunit